MLIDGQDLKDARLTDVRARVSMVLQEPFLLPLSVAENIAYGRPGASRDDRHSLLVAQAHDAGNFLCRSGKDNEIGGMGLLKGVGAVRLARCGVA